MAAIDVKLLPMYNQAIDSGEIGEEISYEMFKEQILWIFNGSSSRDE